MKTFGGVLLVFGIIILMFAFIMDTTVTVSYPNDYGVDMPSRINNLGLMADRQNYMMFGGILLIAGVIMMVVPKGKKNKEKFGIGEDEKVCPKCAETIKSAAVICRYCGQSFDEIGEEKVFKEEEERKKNHITGFLQSNEFLFVAIILIIYLFYHLYKK